MILIRILLLAPLTKALSMNSVNIAPCPLGSIKCHGDLVGALNNIITSNGNANIFGVFAIVLFVMLAFFGLRLIIDGRKDEAQADAAKSYINALIGSILVAGAGIVASTVTDHSRVITVNGSGFITPLTALERLGSFTINIVVGLLVSNLFVQAIRLITAQDEGSSTNAKQSLIRALAGTAVVGLAGPILNYIEPGVRVDPQITGQVIGIANFLATVFGSLAVLAFLIAGVMLVIGVDEALEQRARQLMLTAIVAVLVVVSSYTLIQIFY